MISKILCWIGLHRWSDGKWFHPGKKLIYCKRKRCKKHKTIIDEDGYYHYMAKLRDAARNIKS